MTTRLASDQTPIGDPDDSEWGDDDWEDVDEEDDDDDEEPLQAMIFVEWG